MGARDRQLLASPHYGERWGRHWLDVARYADSNGFEQDYDRPNAWRYRDYVVKSFNQDKPYNQFLREQIAGDEIDWKTARNVDRHRVPARGTAGALPRERQPGAPVGLRGRSDRHVVGRGVLGLTVNCARCHNHKFDPISQKDYYSLAAAMNGWVEVEVPLAPPAEAEAYTKANKEIDAKVEATCASRSRRSKRHTATNCGPNTSRRNTPRTFSCAVFKPEAERTPGEQLLATQVLTGGGGGTAAEIEKLMTPAELAQKKELSAQIARARKAAARSRCRWQRLSPTATGALRPTAGATKRSGVPNAGCRPRTGRTARSCTAARDDTSPPPTYFLIRGDPDSKGSLMKPGFISGGHVRQSADGNSAAGRPHVGPSAGAGANGLRRRRIR